MIVASYNGKKPHGVFYTDDRNCIQLLDREINESLRQVFLDKPESILNMLSLFMKVKQKRSFG